MFKSKKSSIALVEIKFNLNKFFKKTINFDSNK